MFYSVATLAVMESEDKGVLDVEAPSGLGRMHGTNPVVLLYSQPCGISLSLLSAETQYQTFPSSLYNPSTTMGFGLLPFRDFVCVCQRNRDC